MTTTTTGLMLGMRMMGMGHFMLAQASLSQNMGKVAGTLNLIAIVLFFGGMLLSALMFMAGRTEYIKYGLVGAGIGGLSWVIVKGFFEAGTGQTIDIEMQAPQ